MVIKKVIIPACVFHEGISQMIVELNWICPICGTPRGEPCKVRSYDGSKSMVVDGWTNPCGHVDKYSDIREEYRRTKSEQ
jgi:hypothetical protein